MNPLPKPIKKFIQEKHIVSYTAHYQDDFWAANCFYAFDEQKVRLIIMTKTTTRHAQLMLKNGHIVGTIAGQPNKIKDMEGIQFTALARLLENQEERKEAFEIYTKKQPLAKLVNSDIWELSLTEIKHTSNKLIFANKTNWERSGDIQGEKND